MSRADIADAAIAVGFDRTTLVAVADRLGISHSGLYRHVRSRDELVAMAVDRLIDRTAWPAPSDDWKASLAEHAWILWRLTADHPGLARAMFLPDVGPARISRFEALAGELARHGFSPFEAVLAVDTVLDLTIDVRLHVEHFDSRTADTQVRARMLAAWDEIPAADPRVRAQLRDALTGPPDEWFGHKLAIVLDGIEARRLARASSPAGRPGA